MADELLNDQLASGDLMQKFWKNTLKLGKETMTIEVVKSRMLLLETYWTGYVKRHQSLYAYRATHKQAEYFTKDIFADIEAVYVTTKADLTSMLTEKLGPFQQLANQGDIASQQTVNRVTTTSNALPKLTLPRFSGKQEEWESFKELFCSMVKQDPSLTPVLKMQHLISCLEGEAARRLSNLQVTGDNFEVAWKALESRYDNKRLRLSIQLNKLFSMPASSCKSVSEITRLLDTTNESIRALRTLGRPVDTWDDWFIQLIIVNLDPVTREDWEKSLEGTQTFPTFAELIKFLENRIKALEAAHISDDHAAGRNKPNHHNKQPPKLNKSFSAHIFSASTPKKESKPSCFVCKEGHFVGYCPSLLQKTVTARYNLADSLRLCYNCLRPGHRVSSCTSKGRCRHCNQEKKHHTLLHREVSVTKRTPGEPQATISKFESGGQQSSKGIQMYSASVGKSTLLGTAQVILHSPSGHVMLFRALIDPGSEGSFVTEKVAQALSLRKTPSLTTVSGVGGAVTARSGSTVSIKLSSRINSNYSWNFSAAVLPRLSDLLPRNALHGKSWDHLQGLCMADPDFGEPSQVDCLLGADLYPALLLQGVRIGAPNIPIAQETKLGWILTGPTGSNAGQNHISVHLALSKSDPVSAELRRFWEFEEVLPSNILSPAEEECERHFQRTHTRDKSGRYVVRLPFRSRPEMPGSYAAAVSRLLSMERKLSKDAELQMRYSDFLEEYQRLGHMEEVAPATDHSNVNFLPHHAVFKGDENRKLRVVFDASQVSSKGKSLNDFLFTGPKLQRDNVKIIILWRLFPFVFTTDIVKMFRQILVHLHDVGWQRIIWRVSPELPIQEFQLLTVTYGTACAPYLAIRVLEQLAEDEGENFPLGAAILQENTYVDDALAGADTIDQARQARSQLQAILATAGMELDKWSANHPAILDATDSSIDSPVREFNPEDVVSTLGLRWSPSFDEFHYKVQRRQDSTTVTKRSILSEVARLYDPLGWLAPVIVRAKILLQLLWISGKDWDAPISINLRHQWDEFRTQLPELENLRIPRWCKTTSKSSWQLHGFSDASEKAYAAVVYLVTWDQEGKLQSTLLVGKSKVAPIKTVSLPRLELCGAVLLSRLMCKLLGDLKAHERPIFCWTDSQVVLAWLKGSPNTWKTFVANRVSEVLTSVPSAHWSHVRSSRNPADLATRGLTPAGLIDSDIWWKGPKEIFSDAEHLISTPIDETEVEKRMPISTFHGTAETSSLEQLLARFSCFSKMIRVFTFVHRWRANVKLSPSNRPSAILTADEIQRARLQLLLTVQAEHFHQEIRTLQMKKGLPNSSPLRKLYPFLDKKGLLRVGGRLQHSMLTFDEKHPVIVPRSSHFSELLIRDAHQRTLHGGPQLVHSHLLRQYWIPQVRNQIRRLCRLCVRCRRFQGRTYEQQMAPLPSTRVTPARPFHTTGVDYAGPFAIRTSKGRGQRSFKGYLAVFTCFITRACHFELVSDYSSRTFLLAFKRFVARRGLCFEVFSDNGTTFQGADAELRRLFQQASQFSQDVAETLQSDGVRWTFIPPRAPHFGGLWEAAVKSFKGHLRRVIGDAKLTFEEFSTLAACIEACLNSRPLSPISSDASDLAALTPGHFLVGTALLAPPEAPVTDTPLTGIPRWQIVTEMHQHFWRRWQKEVLHQFQQRSKWLEPNCSPRQGDLVLMMDELQPPLKWPLARIEDLHLGNHW